MVLLSLSLVVLGVYLTQVKVSSRLDEKEVGAPYGLGNGEKDGEGFNFFFLFLIDSSLFTYNSLSLFFFFQFRTAGQLR